MNKLITCFLILCFIIPGCKTEEEEGAEIVAETQTDTLTNAKEEVKPECHFFKTGKFQEITKDSLFVDIERNGNSQIEKSQLGINAYNVIWENECYYICELTETTNPQWSNFIGRKYHVQITSTGKDYYTYKCWIQNSEVVVSGKISKLGEI